jgi:hypothetical protein
MTPKAKEILFIEFRASRYISWRYHAFSKIRKDRPEIWSVDILKWIVGQVWSFSPSFAANQMHFVTYARSKKCRLIGFTDKETDKIDKDIEDLENNHYIDFRLSYELMTGLIHSEEETLKILKADIK